MSTTSNVGVAKQLIKASIVINIEMFTITDEIN